MHSNIQTCVHELYEFGEGMATLQGNTAQLRSPQVTSVGITTLIVTCQSFGSLDTPIGDGLLPDQPPVPLALTLAFELLTGASHSAPTFGAYPIQNARDHFQRGSKSAQAHIGHGTPLNERV
jgi:hypothetical protein